DDHVVFGGADDLDAGNQQVAAGRQGDAGGDDVALQGHVAAVVAEGQVEDAVGVELGDSDAGGIAVLHGARHVQRAVRTDHAGRRQVGEVAADVEGGEVLAAAEEAPAVVHGAVVGCGGAGDAAAEAGGKRGAAREAKDVPGHGSRTPLVVGRNAGRWRPC